MPQADKPEVNESRSRMFARVHRSLKQSRGPEIKTVKQRIEWCIHRAAAAIIICFGMPCVLIAALFAAFSIDRKMLLVAFVVLVGGMATVFGLASVAVAPEQFERLIPGPRIIGKALVRITIYTISLFGLLALIHQLRIGM